MKTGCDVQAEKCRKDARVETKQGYLWKHGRTLMVTERVNPSGRKERHCAEVIASKDSRGQARVIESKR